MESNTLSLCASGFADHVESVLVSVQEDALCGEAASETIKRVHFALGQAGVYEAMYPLSKGSHIEPKALHDLMQALLRNFGSGVSASILVMINTILPVLLKNKRRDICTESAARILTGKDVASFAVTEPAGGSFVFDVLSTTAFGSDNVFRINGVKRYITNAPFCDFFLLMAKENENKNKWTNCSLFVVPRAAKGVTVVELPKFGLHESPIGEITLQDVVLPERYCAAKGTGAVDIFNAISKERAIIGVASLIVAKRVTQAFTGAVSKQLSALPTHKLELAKLQANLLEARIDYLASYSSRAVSMQDKSMVSSVSKYALAKAAEEVIERIWDLSNQISIEADVAASIENAYRDSKVFQTFAGTSDIMLDVVYGLAKSNLKRTRVSQV